MTSGQSTIQHVALGEVCEIIAGQSPPSEHYNDKGVGLPFYQGKADFGERYPKPRVWCSKPLKTAQRDDILFCVRAPVGPTNLATEDCCIGRGLAAIRPGKSVDHLFLLHFLRHAEPQFSNFSNGSTFKAITRADLSTFAIPLPPFDAQRRIAAILDKADAIRRKRAQALQLTDQFLQSVFLDMFGDPVTNPKGWDQGTLGDLITSAKDGPHVSPSYSETGIPFLSTRNIRPQRVLWKDLKYISRDEAERQWKKCKPEIGDILYTKGGTTGIAATVDFEEEIAVWVHVALLKTDRSVASPEWLTCMLNSQFCYVQSQRYTHGVTNKDLGLKRMTQIQLYIPPLSLQNQFSSIAAKFKTHLALLEDSRDSCDILFESLVQRAFRGHM